MISTVRPTVHTNPSWKRSFSKTLFKLQGFETETFRLSVDRKQFENRVWRAFSWLSSLTVFHHFCLDYWTAHSWHRLWRDVAGFFRGGQNGGNKERFWWYSGNSSYVFRRIGHNALIGTTKSSPYSLKNCITHPQFLLLYNWLKSITWSLGWPITLFVTESDDSVWCINLVPRLCLACASLVPPTTRWWGGWVKERKPGNDVDDTRVF